MTLYFDLGLGYFVRSLRDRNKLTSISFQRGDWDEVVIIFLRNSAQVELALGATGKFGLKEPGKFDGDYVVAAPAWEKTGAGTTTVYTFYPNFNTDELNALIGHNPPDTANDKASVPLIGGIKFWQDGKPKSSNILNVTVSNDLIKDFEGLPTSANPGYWNKDEADERHGIKGVTTPDFRADLTELTGGAETALDAVDITLLPTGYFLQLETDAGLKSYRLKEGEMEEAAPGFIVPDVQPDEESPRYWQSL